MRDLGIVVISEQIEVYLLLYCGELLECALGEQQIVVVLNGLV